MATSHPTLRYLLLAVLVLTSCNGNGVPAVDQTKETVEYKIAKVEALARKKSSKIEGETLTKKIAVLRRMLEKGELTLEEVRKKINQLLEDEAAAEREARTQENKDKKLAAEVVKKLRRYGKKHGRMPGLGDPTPYNILAWYNKAKKTDPKGARDILLALPKYPQQLDLEKAITALLAILGKSAAAVEKTERDMNSPKQLFFYARKGSEANSWYQPPEKKELDEIIAKIKKDKEETDELFEKYRKTKFKSLVVGDRLEKLKDGLDESEHDLEKEEDPQERKRLNELILSYRVLLEPDAIIRLVDEKIERMEKAALAAWRRAQPGGGVFKYIKKSFSKLRKKNLAVSNAEKALEKAYFSYSQRSYQEIEKEFNRKQYKALIEECEEIEADALVVARATNFTADEKEIALKEYIVRLKEIKEELNTDFLEKLKKATNTYSIFERIGQWLERNVQEIKERAGSIFGSD